MPETNGTEWPLHLNAVVAAPANHRLLFEDDAVRVLEVTAEPWRAREPSSPPLAEHHGRAGQPRQEVVQLHELAHLLEGTAWWGFLDLIGAQGRQAESGN